MYKFKTDLDNLDERSDFANRICKMIYQKNGGDIDASVKEAEPFFDDLYAFVRNIYECIDTEIPLCAYWELLEYGKDNYDFTEEEYQEVIQNSKDACVLYYSK